MELSKELYSRPTLVQFTTLNSGILATVLSRWDPNNTGLQVFVCRDEKQFFSTNAPRITKHWPLGIIFQRVFWALLSNKVTYLFCLYVMNVIGGGWAQLLILDGCTGFSIQI